MIYVPGIVHYEKAETSTLEGYVRSAEVQIETRRTEINALELIRDAIVKVLEERKYT